MLRLLSLSSLVLFGAQAVSDVFVLIGDDNMNFDHRRTRVTFRGDDDETGVTEYVVCGCTEEQGATKAVSPECSDPVTPHAQKKTAQPAGSGGMAATYNTSTGIMTIKNRGGYGQDELQTLELSGPGTLYTVHLDVEPRDDFLKVTDK